MNRKPGILFIVATPIGNLADMTLRAIDILTQVDLILAEDTRHASILLRHHNIHTPLKSFHEHNESARQTTLLRQLNNGTHLALISDAGTPLISDPGYRLVSAARAQGIDVTPIPGASAVIAALSASGQPTERFCFEGFLPAKPEARKHRLQHLASEPRTLVIYESNHRIIASLKSMASEFGDDRNVTVAREISKKFETFYHGTLAEVIQTLTSNTDHQKGEFVIILNGATAPEIETQHAVEIMRLLLTEIPLKPASKLAAKILNGNSKELYALGLEIKNK